MGPDNKTILVAEDEPILLEIAVNWLEREGYRVLTAGNGSDALAMLKTTSVNLIVSDIRMPVVDGIALLKSVKAAGQHTPSLIFVTGFGDVSPREAYDLGAEGILSKPYEREQLTEMVQKSLTDRQELWRQPPPPRRLPLFQTAFESLQSALSLGLIAFGRGGFCVNAVHAPAEGDVQLAVNFRADQKEVAGSGIVRWVERREHMVGVEIATLDDSSCRWVTGLTHGNQAASFIPGTTRSSASAAR